MLVGAPIEDEFSGAILEVAQFQTPGSAGKKGVVLEDIRGTARRHLRSHGCQAFEMLDACFYLNVAQFLLMD